MRKLMALLTVLMLALGGIAMLAEAESIEVPALAPTDGDMALDGLALDGMDIGEVELGDIADLKLPEADVLLPEAGEESPADTANDGERVKINSTNFPDKEFRNYVKAAYDLDGDGALSDGERLPVDFMRIGYDEGCVLVKCRNMVPV